MLRQEVRMATIGDDIKSRVGTTIAHRVLLEARDPPGSAAGPSTPGRANAGAGAWMEKQ